MNRQSVAERAPSDLVNGPFGQTSSTDPVSSWSEPPQGGNALVITVLALLAVIAGLSWAMGGTFAVVVSGAVVTTALVVAFGLENAGTAVIAGAMFFAPLSSRQLGTPPPTITYADVLFVAGFVLLLPHILRRPLRAPTPFLAGSAILVCFCLVAVVVHPGLLHNAAGSLRLTYAIVLLPLAFLWWSPSPGRITVFAASYFVGALGNIVYALLVQGPVWDGRYRGLTPHPNALGMSLALALALWPYLAYRLPTMRWALYLSGGLLAYGVWVSGSRSALIAVVMLVILHLILERTVGALMLVLAAVTVVAASATQIASNGSNGLARLLGTQNSTASDAVRRTLITHGLDHIKAHPLTGSGFEQIRVAHNIYVQVGAAVGLVALVGFLLIAWSIVRPAFTAPRPLQRLAYPALVYVVIGQLNDTLSDTFIWATVVLAMLADPRIAGHLRVGADARPRAQSASADDQHRTLT